MLTDYHARLSRVMGAVSRLVGNFVDRYSFVRSGGVYAGVNGERVEMPRGVLSAFRIRYVAEVYVLSCPNAASRVRVRLGLGQRLRRRENFDVETLLPQPGHGQVERDGHAVDHRPERVG